ncbi:MAG: SGNH/GDSL hydrolase family protein [Desulfobaccales bacterium]
MGAFKAQPESRNRLSRWALNAGLIVLSVMAVIVLLETALRFTPYRCLLTRDRHLRYYYQFDPVKGFDIKPNVKDITLSVDNRIEYRIWSNELGCFDEPYHGEQEFILLAGDSFTHSFAPFPEKWGTQIEKLLHYRVLKCGVNGYGTSQELEKAREIISKIKEKPQLIIVGYFWNDLSDDYSFPDLTVVDGFLVESAKYKDPKTNELLTEKLTKRYTLWEKLFSGAYPLSWGEMIRYYLSQHLIIMNLINDATARIFPGKKIIYTNPNKFLAFEDETKNGKIWERHLQNLSAFKDLATANQANLLVVLIPTNTQVYPFLAPHQGLDLERPNKILGRFLKAQGIDYLDLLPLMRSYADQTPCPSLDPDKDLYWRHNSHWSIRGEHLVGLLVSRYILTHRLVQAPDGDARLKAIEEKL